MAPMTIGIKKATWKTQESGKKNITKSRVRQMEKRSQVFILGA